MPAKISCIICAYNEAERIGDVLKVVNGHPQISEVIVVDDGSTDGTSEVARSFPAVKLIVQEHNQGKSRALARGALAARGDFILCLDADLQNLTRENITALCEPILNNTADISISVRGNSLSIYRAIGLDFVSGERVFPRTFITEHTAEIEALPRFGIESFLNRLVIDRNLRIAIVHLNNVVNTRKRDKVGWLAGTLAEWKMVFDVVGVLSPLEVIRQNYRMLQLANRNDVLRK